ncbi:BTAD domain-containing putative transcriptional regulator [Streptomyces sp. NPDC096176]|uniref:AfsR/SARP family transcriptional regulator n=1 Tax=Streptomyces sp. NPDC096176 TaxID=3366079 RepID=UPI0038200186
MSAHPSFLLLGPLVVQGAQGEVPLGGNRQRILLTMLLLEANRVVGVERLIAAIWSDTPPVSARSQVRICVSGLRRQFSAARVGAAIETHKSGYLLRLPEHEIDLYCFENLLAQTRSESKTACRERLVERLRYALQMWRGQIGAGLDSALLESSALKFHEDRSAALECRFELELQLGQYRRIVGELTQHVAEHPFRETLCAQLMITLHRCGRTAEALSLFRETRRRLVEDLGIEPGERLRSVEHSILVGDLDDGPSGPWPAEPIVGSMPERPAGPEECAPGLGPLSMEDRITLLEQEIAVLREEQSRVSRQRR